MFHTKPYIYIHIYVYISHLKPLATEHFARIGALLFSAFSRIWYLLLFVLLLWAICQLRNFNGSSKPSADLCRLLAPKSRPKFLPQISEGLPEIPALNSTPPPSRPAEYSARILSEYSPEIRPEILPEISARNFGHPNERNCYFRVRQIWGTNFGQSFGRVFRRVFGQSILRGRWGESGISSRNFRQDPPNLGQEFEARFGVGCRTFEAGLGAG